jgi:hypothetical protein
MELASSVACRICRLNPAASVELSGKRLVLLFALTRNGARPPDESFYLLCRAVSQPPSG